MYKATFPRRFRRLTPTDLAVFFLGGDTRGHFGRRRLSVAPLHTACAQGRAERKARRRIRRRGEPSFAFSFFQFTPFGQIAVLCCVSRLRCVIVCATFVCARLGMCAAPLTTHGSD